MVASSVLDGLLAVFVILAALAVYTRLRATTLNMLYPPSGKVRSVAGRDVHFVDLPGSAPDAPTVVVIHGASGNLHEPMMALRPVLEGRYRLVFVDRPGHGWSARRDRADAAPLRQADLIAALLDDIGIGEAVIVGHSWGGSVAAAFGVNHPGRTAGLVFLAPATHPWPGGVTWYYRVTTWPVIGRLFTEVLALPLGKLLRDRTVRCVFAPEPVPDDYADEARVDLVLRPATFRANAEDVVDLHGHVTALSPRYREISAPTVIIADAADKVVYTHIHSAGLKRDIDGARLVLLEGAGHMPHHSRPKIVAEAIAEVAGRRSARLDASAIKDND